MKISSVIEFIPNHELYKFYAKMYFMNLYGEDNIIYHKEEDYYTDGGYGDNYEVVTKVEVVNVYKTESYALKGVKIIELAIIIYINTIIDTFDAGDYLWDFKLNLETYLGKSNFRIKLLNVINEN